MKNLINVLKSDLDSVLSRDPAARNKLEIILLYSGLHAVWSHRIAHWFWTHKLYLNSQRDITTLQVPDRVLRFIQEQKLEMVSLLIMAWVL